MRAFCLIALVLWAATAQAGTAGRFLVASPDMGDPRFAHTVVYMIADDDSGALGVVINHPLGTVDAATLLSGLGLDADGVSGMLTLYNGGPVELMRGLVVHTPDYAIEGTLRVSEGVAVTGRETILGDIARGRGPRRARIFFGYAGWGPGQLEAERARGAWVVVPADTRLLFDDDTADIWERAIARYRLDL